MDNGSAIVPKPWGHEEILWDGPLYILKKLYIAPGQRISLQYHPEKDETMFLVGGSGWIVRGGGGKSEPLIEGKAYNVPPGLVHRIGAYAEEGCIVLEVSTPHRGDSSTTRLEDDYNRA